MRLRARPSVHVSFHSITRCRASRKSLLVAALRRDRRIIARHKAKSDDMADVRSGKSTRLWSRIAADPMAPAFANRDAFGADSI